MRKLRGGERCCENPLRAFSDADVSIAYYGLIVKLVQGSIPVLEWEAVHAVAVVFEMVVAVL